jgi:hypothetical protein
MRVAHLDDILHRAHKRNGNRLHALHQAKGQVGFVFFGKSGNAQAHARQVDALVGGQHPADHHPRQDDAPFDGNNNQHKPAVIEQEPVSGVDRFEEFRERDRDLLLLAVRQAGHPGNRPHQFIKRQLHGAGKTPTRSLGPCKSSKMPDRNIEAGRNPPMLLMRAACSSCVPCEKLSRATFMPALNSFSRVASSWLAGPMVATILARRSIRSLSLHKSIGAQKSAPRF